jgi:hypothetical protein
MCCANAPGNHKMKHSVISEDKKKKEGQMALLFIIIVRKEYRRIKTFLKISYMKGLFYKSGIS